MIDIQESNIDEILKSAQKQAAAQQTPTLVSFTEEIKAIHPIVFFHAGENMSRDRIFWSNADQEVEFVGIGRAICYQDLSTSYQKLKINLISNN